MVLEAVAFPGTDPLPTGPEFASALFLLQAQIMTVPIHTHRLTLRQFTPDDLDGFAALHADPQTMADLGGPISRNAAEAKLTRYLEGQAQYGTTRLHVSDALGFIGYVGTVMRAPHPLGLHPEIGWRLFPQAWGKGYATEAASAALPHAFAITGAQEILAHTSPDNHASQAVMTRLGLIRDPSRDYIQADPKLGEWHGLVWVARAEDWR